MGQRKTVASEVPVHDQDALIALLVMRCEELKLATSSLDKLPGVSSAWLHNIKVKRQKTTDLNSVFPLLDVLGLEVVVRVKRATGKRVGGVRAAQAIRNQRGAVLTGAQREQAAMALAGLVTRPVVSTASEDVQLPDPALKVEEVPPEIRAARQMARQAKEPGW